jgi:N-acetylglutamate synthase-like GNAT family acetyltransferase
MAELIKLVDENQNLLDQVPGGLLEGTDLDKCLGVAAVEDGKLLGCAFLVALPHIEGIWVREDKRGSPLANQMMEHLKDRARDIGIDRIFAYAFNEKIADYLGRIGYHFVASAYEKEVK